MKTALCGYLILTGDCIVSYGHPKTSTIWTSSFSTRKTGSLLILTTTFSRLQAKLYSLLKRVCFILILQPKVLSRLRTLTDCWGFKPGCAILRKTVGAMYGMLQMRKPDCW